MSVSDCGGLRSPSSLAKALTNQDAFQKKFGHDPVAKEVFQEYFSYYGDDLLPLNRLTMNEIDWIVERKKLGNAIAEECGRIIFGKTPFDSTHRMLPKDMLRRALKAQSAFDRASLNLKVRDCYSQLHAKAWAERKMLEQLIRKEGELSGAERNLDSEISKKARYYKQPFERQVFYSLNQRDQLIDELEQRILKLPEIEDDKGGVREILGHAKQLNRAPLMRYKELHASNDDHYVYASGHPFRDPKNAKFIIIYNNRGISPEKVGAQIEEIRRNGLDRQVVHDKPNRALRFGVDGEAAVQLSYENVKETADVHRMRKPDEKTRRRIETEKSWRLENRKIRPLCLANFSDGWSANVKATGVDGKEAIAVIHHMILDMLGGQISRISEGDCRFWAEYLDAVATNKMPKRSYQEDPRFLQALDLHRMMYEDQRDYFRLKPDSVHLEKAKDAKYSWESDQRRVQHLSEGFFLVWSLWQENVKRLIEELQKPKNREIRDLIGSDALDHLKGISAALNGLVFNTPREIQDILKQRYMIDDKYNRIWNEMDLRNAPRSEKNESGVARVNEIEKIWKDWHQSKTPKEVDEIFSEALKTVQKQLKSLTPHFVGLVSFSSNENQERIRKGLDQPLLSLYDSTIPQILSLPGKVKITLDELEQGLETSLLTLELAKTRATQTQMMNEIEFERSLGSNVARRNDAQRPILL